MVVRTLNVVYLNHKMQAVLLFALLGLVHAAPLGETAKDDAITGHIKKIDTDLVALNGLLDQYTGGLVAALPIKASAETVETSMKAAVTDIKKEPIPLPDAGLQTMLDAIKTLNGNVNTTMTALGAKAEKFGAAKPIVQKILVRMSDVEKELGDSLVAHASPAMQAAAKEEDQKLRDYFKIALTQYNT
ncbi:hydrophobic surface binding protein A-domain-containing protein [Protomyces lactucae-debilis]|uniref:Hydrophobic surface binding protein A-domain-containing protein n=1 Tax=Protomyces lactucae-debilis TaxID=2754530 RepID=A0A1Y2EXR7_PROLT|nr:hydrophobic surface binding protein A-domain-containing protein [Protomyces lactucae-debilis]ORY76389.1 hydrophobic surface binding protein A-domain-containing protein [Protomyces lactucae-debilis]